MAAWQAMTLMTVNQANSASEERLGLGSNTADLSLVAPWIERLGSEHGVPASTQFAMNLCLEEVLSNIIRHGYGNKPGSSIVVRYSLTPDKSHLLVIDDEAPHFDPLTAEESPVEDTLNGIRVGGLGLRLVKSFATNLQYESKPIGNRLSISFAPTA